MICTNSTTQSCSALSKGGGLHAQPPSNSIGSLQGVSGDSELLGVPRIPGAGKVPGGARGFTVVEMLLAMVLTVVLLTGLMMMASATAQDQRRLIERRDQAEPVWVDPVARLIEADLLMGVGISDVIQSGPRVLSSADPDVLNSVGSTSGGSSGRNSGDSMDSGGSGGCFYVVTYNASSGGDRAIAHEPVLVSYELFDSFAGGVLLRRQRSLVTPHGITSTSRSRLHVQVLATGIDAVTIGHLTLRVSQQDQSAHPTPRSSSDFTILVDGRPIQLHAITAQTGFTITPRPSDDTTKHEISDTTPHHYERTLLTR